MLDASHPDYIVDPYIVRLNEIKTTNITALKYSQELSQTTGLKSVARVAGTTGSNQGNVSDAFIRGGASIRNRILAKPLVLATSVGVAIGFVAAKFM